MPCPNSTILKLISRASSVLGDDGPDCAYTRWTKPWLIEALNEALCALHSIRPDAFSEMVDVTLSPGSEQSVCDQYSQMVEIKTTEGSVATAGKGDEYYSQVLRKKKCIANACSEETGAYAVTGYVLNSLHPCSFSVTPPVPLGQNPRVRAMVIKKPPAYCPSDENKLIDIECRYVPAVMEYVLYRAYGSEIDSSSSEAASKMHYQAFLALLDKGYLYDARLGSGYWKGQLGTGDPTWGKK